MEEDDGGVGVLGLKASNKVRDVLSFDAFKVKEVAVTGSVVLPSGG